MTLCGPIYFHLHHYYTDFTDHRFSLMEQNMFETLIVPWAPWDTASDSMDRRCTPKKAQLGRSHCRRVTSQPISGNITIQYLTTLSLWVILLDSMMVPDGEVGRWYGILHGAKQQGCSFGYKKPGLPLVSSSIESY